ncbi:putative enoyl-CoA hydratase echA8 [Baekduia alba]|uniref:enoyl-CoA hydratase/isomerase family protein n=1 Tax=Baekduia alba TaxID=2997333 RepID=UPI002342640A|nr:enoyl-CoA hydratase/isomerase family protein [Baekduia alba]WCB95381.1 putative enoyl-CoA hydratase echA8 [Baekduia alba]
MSDGLSVLHADGGVVELVLDRPDTRNALSYELAARLVEELRRAAEDPDTRVVLLRGNGKSFCSGGDLQEFRTSLDDSAAVYHDSGRVWAELVRTLVTLPLPTIVAAHGHALAGGCAIVAAADVALLAEGTALGMSEIRIGLFPAIVYGTLARAVGHRAARELALTGRRVDAGEAVALGLAHRLVAADDLLAQARALATDLAGLGRDPLRLGKELMNEAERLDVDGATQLGRAMRGAFMTSADFRAGVAQFLERT